MYVQLQMSKNMNKIYRLVNIQMHGNEHGRLLKDVIYADLIDWNGNTMVSATLEHILKRIRSEGMPVQGVSITTNVQLNTACSRVTLDKYNG